MADKKTKKTVAKAKTTEEAPLEVKNEKKLEGLTNATVATGVISFKDGSGSADLLSLIVKHGFIREKVIEAGEKLKLAGKAFAKSDVTAKYNKVAGIIKNLQNAGFKLPTA